MVPSDYHTMLGHGTFRLPHDARTFLFHFNATRNINRLSEIRTQMIFCCWQKGTIFFNLNWVFQPFPLAIITIYILEVLNMTKPATTLIICSDYDDDENYIYYYILIIIIAILIIIIINLTINKISHLYYAELVDMMCLWIYIYFLE